MKLNIPPFTLILYNILLYTTLFSSISQHLQYASAQLLDQCEVSVAALFLDPNVNSCLPINPLLQLINGTKFTPKLVNDTSTTLCGMPDCSSTVVSLMENTFNQNCASNSGDINDNNELYKFISLYVPLKQGVCQRIHVPPTNGTFCITILTQQLQEFDKKHPNKLGWSIIGNFTATREYISSIPTEVVCTKCNQDMINPLNTYVSVRQLYIDPTIVGIIRNLQQSIQGKCGVDFIQTIPPPVPSAPSAAPSIHIHLWIIPCIFVIISIILQ